MSGILIVVRLLRVEGDTAGESSPGTESVNTTTSFHHYFMFHYSSSLSSWSRVNKIILRGTASIDSRLNVVG